ncbi:Ger(x)C family spore germination protein [Gracilibacillus sp. YIM 98692]|uniref:Ger(x)C family spore germination protein n=1 Tax=Gracilibacillus sp. YIM 98692 TaxID=2663532 RepID=UPI0013D47988|nr:Ger(x)C family spore germination protein [Gracilibacillus sp. YIM 98692]
MKRKIMILLLSFFMCLITAGCWDSHELTEMALATGLAIDKEGDEYTVTAQVLNPGEIAGAQMTNRLSVSTYSTTGKTIFEAVRRLTQTTPRKLYLSHLRIIIFGEELAEEGIGRAIDFVSRDHEMRTDFTLSIAKGMRAEDVLKILTPLEKVPANKVFSSLEMSQDAWAPTKVVHVDELIDSLTSPSKQAVLNGLYVQGDIEIGSTLDNVERVNSPTLIKIDHIGVFRHDQLIGWLDEEQSKGFNYITNNVSNTVGSVACDKPGRIVIEVINTNTELKGKTENGSPKMVVHVTSEVNIGEVLCPIDIMKKKNISDVEKKVEKKMKDIMYASIDKAKELNSDIFGFGEVLKRQVPKQWKNWEQNWDEEFTNLNVDVKADVKIRRTGTISESFLNKMEKNKKKDE